MISIIMPAYNAEKYIEQSIQSVLAQTYTNWELLVIDDGSSDQTAAIVKAWQQKDSRICYISNKKNIGVAETRNRGISAAHGEWIAFLDSDDCWHSEKLQLQIDTAVKCHADFLFTGSSFMDEYSSPLNYYLPAPPTVNYKQLLKQNVISCSSILIRKSLVAQYPMKHAENMHEDFAVWLQILRDKKISAYGINHPLLIYRISRTSKSGNKIKAGLMTYRVYRYIGLPVIPAFYYWCCYFYRSLKKYHNLLG